MVVKNKWVAVFNEYRKNLKEKFLNIKPDKGREQMVAGNRSKNRCLDFYIKNNRWPSRLSVLKKERLLAQRFENYVSKQSKSHDPEFRKIVMRTGRISNNKRKHNVTEFKKEIMSFLREHGRVPGSSRQYETIEGEARLRQKLDYYTKEKNDTTLLGKIYDTDKCHLSGIPLKYRRIINESLDIDKPLIRLVQS
jgi:hypothetical protein